MPASTESTPLPGRRIYTFADSGAGLRAVLIIDGMSDRIAAGGTRTRTYPSLEAAVTDAGELARAMSLKAAIAGVGTAGAKMVVMDHDGLDREAAFRALGRHVQSMAGTFYTAGDLGTTVDDLLAMAETTEFVTTREPELGDAVGRGVRACAAACARARGHEGLAGLRVAIQGCGAMGVGVARAMAEAGTELLVANVNAEAASAVAAETGAQVVAPEDILAADADIVAPCAIGGALTDEAIDAMRAWAVCGAANNVLADQTGAARLRSRDIMFVPGFLASAGALIAGICEIRGSAQAENLIEALGTTTTEVLARSVERDITTTAAATAIAAEKSPSS